MADSPVIGIAGATGALGAEIVAALAQSPFRPEEVVPLARPSSKTPFVEYDGREIAVDDVADEVLERLDLLFLALPREAAEAWGERAIHAGVKVVDCSGALRSEAVPVGVPWINPEGLHGHTRGAVCVPTPEAILAASVLGPLQRAGLAGDAEATFLIPASRFGRDAIQELSAQVIALFNSGTPPRKVFPDGLAFDLLPSAGDTGAPTLLESRVEDEVRAMTDVELVATRIGVPVFSGLSMELRIEPTRRPMIELVSQILRDGGVDVPSSDVVRGLPRPRRVEGRPFPSAGRIRVDDAGEVLRIWASFDNLRGSATVAVGLAGLLLGARDV